ncbi:MAG: YfhO family protein, partial [Patescibacteria group bacterium]
FFYIFNAPLIMDRRSYETRPVTLEFLKKFPGRVLPLFVDDWDDSYYYELLNKSITPSEKDAPYMFDLRFQTYFPNFALLNSVETVEINDPLLNVDLGKLLASIGTRQLVTTGGEEKLNKLYVKRDDGTDISIVERTEIFKERLPLANFLGIRYILSPFRIDDLRHSLELANYFPLYIIGGSDKPPIPVFVFANPTAKPLAYFTKITDFKSDPSEIYKSFKESGFRDIIVECKACKPQSFTAEGKIFLQKKENGLVSLKTQSPDEQFLVFTQNYLPGWKAFLDGQKVPMYKVNTVFPGIFVPAGTHKAVFKYDYWSLFNPKWIF